MLEASRYALRLLTFWLLIDCEQSICKPRLEVVREVWSVTVEVLRDQSASEMSMRRATQCLGKLPEKPRSRGPSQPTSPLWPGYHTRWHDSEQETSKLIHAASPVASVTSERVYRSHETVKAWLDSSPTSVLDDQNDDESVPSSFESLSSSPLGSPRYRSHSTSRFFSSSSELNQPAHVRVRILACALSSVR